MNNELGAICVYTVKEGLYDVDKIKKEFTNLGLPLNHIPGTDNEIDAFKTACSLVSQKWKKRIANDGTEIRIKITNVKEDSQVVIRSIVQESVQAKSDSDGFESNVYEGNVFKLVLKKQFSPMVIDVFTPDGKTPGELIRDGVWADGVDYGQMVQDILDMRDQLKQNHTYAANIRRMIVAYITMYCGGRSFFGKGGVFITRLAIGDNRNIYQAVVFFSYFV